MDMDTTQQERRCPDGDSDGRSLCDSGSRNRYFPRKTMTAGDFTREQAYGIGRRRLLNRSLFGWGVVHGLEVNPDAKHRLTVDPGLALDRHGREIFVAQAQHLRHGNFFFHIPGYDLSHPPKPAAGRWLLSAHYAERPVDKVRLSECDDCGKPEWNRVCETVVFSLSPLKEKDNPTDEPGCLEDCGCPKEPRKQVESETLTLQPQILIIKPELSKEQIVTDAAANEMAGASAAVPLKESAPDEAPVKEQKIPATPNDKLDRMPPYPRGPHSTLCCWSHNTHVEGDGTLCEWNGYCVDPDDPVAIAIVTLTGIDTCGDPIFGAVEECPPRRIVKRNDMLFDLIRGCDLTRIKAISWARHAHQDYVVWKDFQNEFDPNASIPEPSKCLTKLQIDFTGPVLKKTITPDAVAITVVLHDSGSGWAQMLRVPVVGFTFDAGPTPETTRTAKVLVRRDWFNGEINIDTAGADRSTRFEAGSRRPEWYPRVEVEIFGDLILDCRGQPVDANSVGPAIVPTGNGTPGGTCRFTFRVVPPDAPAPKTQDTTQAIAAI